LSRDLCKVFGGCDEVVAAYDSTEIPNSQKSTWLFQEYRSVIHPSNPVSWNC